MKARTTSKLIPWYSGVALTMVFCLWVIAFENHTIDKARENLEKHALVVADALWNFNSAGVKEYLRLAAEADNYLSLKILNKDDQVFKRSRSFLLPVSTCCSFPPVSSPK